MPHDTASTLHDLEVGELKGKIHDLNDRWKHTLSLLKESDDRLNAILGLKKSLAGVPPARLKVKAKNKITDATAVMVASDWHIEERVDPKTVDGMNEFTPDIAKARATHFFSNGLKIVQMCRHESNIKTLILALLGDFISGYIHEDLAESNFLSPTEATLMAYRLICGGIDYLLEEGDFDQILIPCTFGNHARTTKKMRCNTGAKNSYEWMMYQLLAEQYVNEPRVKFSIANGYFVFVDVYGKTIRFHHGDEVRYAGGVGGLTIPLNKAIAQWNKMRPVYLDVLGHWHSRHCMSNVVVNGSLIGFSPFSIRIKASYEEPVQSFFLMHPNPKRGKIVETPIFLD